MTRRTGKPGSTPPVHGPVPAGERDDLWRAVVERDAAADGAFVLAVRTTGIYCRPTCPARRPLRRNVTFYGVPEAAERDGYRACKRCRPREADPADDRVAVVRAVCRELERSGTGPGLGRLGEIAGYSPTHLQRIFKRLMGISPRQYAEAVRAERLRGRLREGETVTRALYRAGYGSSSRVYERANERFGMSPAAYRRRGRGEAIRVTAVRSPLGWLLVAATDRGVCAVRVGKSKKGLLDEFRREFGRARVSGDDGRLGEWTAAVVAHVEGSAPHLDLPLDVRATAFQWRVWEALRRIPYGETVSYGELARALGNAKGARAVARACASNPVAIVVPCHRVVPKTGGVGGYRWGPEVKRKLLARERKGSK
jgi:AraC family transcriptional regulator of adaptative response/methylated-DNA-[protein]-cysteine methyltransferase